MINSVLKKLKLESGWIVNIYNTELTLISSWCSSTSKVSPRALNTDSYFITCHLRPDVIVFRIHKDNKIKDDFYKLNTGEFLTRIILKPSKEIMNLSPGEYHIFKILVKFIQASNCP